MKLGLLNLVFVIKTNILEDQGIPNRFGHHLWPSWHGRHYQ